MNILWMTHKGEHYLGDPINRHGFEQAVAKITNSVFAGEEWPLHVTLERLEATVKRVMPDVDWIIDRDLNLYTPKPPGRNVAHLVSDLHGKHHYSVDTPEGHIDLLNKAGYRALFLRYTEIHGTTAPVDIYRQTLKPSAYWLPWSFDPDMFYPRLRAHDATFIGCTTSPFYPLRKQMWAELKGLSKKYNTFTAEAPRGKTFELLIKNHLAGDTYADILGRSGIFIFDCSIFRYPLMKFTEGLGSGCLVMATEPSGAGALGLVDEMTYVEIEPNNWRDKLHYYLENPNEGRKIADRGLEMALKYHTHDVRARQFVRYLGVNM